MNILTLNEAIDQVSLEEKDLLHLTSLGQLGTSSWTRTQLADQAFLPLGISPSML
jgi:hypothetical protein